MPRVNETVFAPNKVLVKIGLIFRGFAHCHWFDAHGDLRSGWFEVSTLAKPGDVLRPRTAWAETRDLSEEDLRREKAIEEAEKAERQRIARRNARAKRKRRVAA